MDYTKSDLQLQAQSIADQYGIPRGVFSSVLQNESGFNQSAINVNKNGTTDYGVAQINSGNVARMGLDLTKLQTDPNYNMDVGAQILSGNYKAYGDWTSALSAYNTGKPDSSTGIAYANKIMGGAGNDTSAAGAAVGAGSAAGGSGGASFLSDPWGYITDKLKSGGYTIGVVILGALLIAAGIWKGIK